MCGAGVGGLMCASALGARGCRVLLLEGQNQPAPSAKGEVFQPSSLAVIGLPGLRSNGVACRRDHLRGNLGPHGAATAYARYGSWCAGSCHRGRSPELHRRLAMTDLMTRRPTGRFLIVLRAGRRIRWTGPPRAVSIRRAVASTP
ncbi:NAD(P)-binding protein [Streptomyces sp. NPDC088350]|uniref:NAD(P)-binding protein n=1 Tax=Streptomyces sp. NPDC088350 TaxID=3365854 RepID=UPI00382C55F6